MEARPREDLEQDIRACSDRADHAGATTLALRGYGPEIYAFLAATHRSEGEAAEVFSMFAEGLWRALPTFGWQSSFRTWAYAVARRTSLRFRRDAGRRARRQEPLDDGSGVAEVAAQVRTATQQYLRTEVKARVAALREALPHEDQELLLLRVDRNLSWIELAHVLRGEEEAALEGAALTREAARLRKRFQLLKDRLREMARREGLLGEDG
jgi:RNA polymerase sigma-70 factor (ECF subfamily)